ISRNIVSRIAVVVATLSTGWSGAAIAQSAAVQSQATEPDQAAIDDIVVTAQRRQERLQDTPIAVTAFNATALANKNVEDISGIAQFTPNLQFDATAPLSGAS